MNESYKTAIIWAILLHLVLLSFFLINFNFFSAPNYVMHNKPLSATFVEMSPPKVEQKEKISTPNPATLPQIEKHVLLPESPPIKNPMPSPQPVVAKPKPTLKSLPTPVLKPQKTVPVTLPHATATPSKITKKPTKKIVNKGIIQKEHQLNDKLWQQALAEEDESLNAEKQQQAQGVLNKYNALILQAIRQHWVLPDNYQADLSCQLLIRLAKDGSVIAVELTKSSGNTGFDRSARAAVYKASPLPVPEESSIFKMMQEINLTVKP